MPVAISITQGDVVDIDADVLALKYAQAFHSSDGFVARRLRERGVDEQSLVASETEVRREEPRALTHGVVVQLSL